MLQALGHPSETITCISLDNRFSFALGRRPPQGGAVWLQLGNNVGYTHPLPVEMLFGHADLLIVQRINNTEAERINMLLAMYPDLLTKDYALIGTSEYWTLYRKKP